MHIEFVGRHSEVTAKLKAEATGYLERIILIASSATSARVILTEDKYRRIAEVELFAPGGDLVAKCEGTDMQQVLHDALRRIEQQAVKHNQRDQTIRDHPKPAVDPDGDIRGVTENLSTP
ncbi:MAG: HPF/RaiA family ribosome-associated protein [Janthinobacterium lividum]